MKRLGKGHIRAASAAFLTASALVVATPVPTGAAYPGENGVIVYTNDCNLITVNPDGGTPQMLLDLTDCVLGPVWSPQGKRLVFSRGGGSFSSDLWIARSDGRGRRQLTEMTGGESTGGWSPSGQQVVFTQSTKRNSGDLYVIRADGTGLKQLTTGGARDWSPAWSPVARRIAFVRSEGASSQDLWTISPKGNNPVQLTHNITEGEGSSSSVSFGGINGFAWSPSGEQIALAVNKGEGLSLLYVMNADGSNLHEVEGIDFEAGYPAWSPDGTLIVYVAAETLATIPPEGGTEQPLPGTEDGSSPDWQPLP